MFTTPHDRAPKKILKTLTQIQRSFFWGGTEEKRKIAWVAWEVVCKPKLEGGLGLRDLNLFNISLLGKWEISCGKGFALVQNFFG